MELEGPQKALDALTIIKDNKQIGKYYLYYAVLGELYYRLSQKENAIAAYEKARKLTLSKQEQRFLTDKIAVIWHK
jgi:RNA polymerase sigma-70 factor (ECF subfamily)